MKILTTKLETFEIVTGNCGKCSFWIARTVLANWVVWIEIAIRVRMVLLVDHHVAEDRTGATDREQEREDDLPDPGCLEGPVHEIPVGSDGRTKPVDEPERD